MSTSTKEVARMKTRLVEILYDKGWTEMELSRRTGLAQSYINRVKNSRIVPTVSPNRTQRSARRSR